MERRSPIVSSVCSSTARIEHHDTPGHEQGGKGNVLGHHEVTGHGVIDDVLIRHVGATTDAYRGDEIVPRRSLESLIGNQDGGEVEPPRRAVDDLFHLSRRGIGVDPDRHRNRPWRL